MLKFTVFIIALLGFHVSFAQNAVENKKALSYLTSRGELYLKFDTRKFDVLKYGQYLSLDHKTEGHYQYAYANMLQFKHLLKLGFQFDVQTPPSLLQTVKMAKKTNEIFSWDTYPTYEQYVEFMQLLANTYPDICRLEKFGESIEKRDLLVLKISDNVETEEAEPDFLYTSTMHGDETTGYYLLLRLANYLLENYNDSERIKDLVDNTEIWINPLSNPDGTYAAGNHTVNGATRNNAASHLTGMNGLPGVDLNRNFPDPAKGPNPDGNDLQHENIAMIDFMKEQNFVLTANLHSGAELINYPWDTWRSLHADNDWYRTISRQYADTVQTNSPTGYFNDEENGITNGAAWYLVAGGRQDYTNFYLHGREVTIELSSRKLPADSQLDSYWKYHYRSLLNYIKQTHYGLRGIVSDAETQKPLRAKVEIIGHDRDSSDVYSEYSNGNYHRMIHPNTYSVRFSCLGYSSKVINDVTIEKDKSTELNVELSPTQLSADKVGVESVKLFPNPLSEESQLTFYITKNTKAFFSISSLTGSIHFKMAKELNAGHHYLNIPQLDLPNGVYVCHVRLGEQQKQMKIIVSK